MGVGLRRRSERDKRSGLQQRERVRDRGKEKVRDREKNKVRDG